jgi:hypothetical protein
MVRLVVRAPLVGVICGLAHLLLLPLLSGGGGLFVPIAYLLPIVPLTAFGLLAPFRRMALAALIAFAVTFFAGNPILALLFAALALFPAMFAIGLINLPSLSGFRVLELLTGFAASMVALIGFLSWEGEGLEGLLREQVTGAITQLTQSSPEGITPEMFAPLLEWSFLIPAVGVWMWLLLLWWHLRMAHPLAIRFQQKPARPQLSWMEGSPSPQLLGWLGLCLFAALAGGTKIAFIGTILSIIFLLPYFITGMVFAHHKTQGWQHRSAALGALYGFIGIFLWPVGLVAAMAVFRHCLELLNNNMNRSAG